MPEVLNHPALAELDRKQVLATSLRTAALQKIAPELRDQAFFSAGVTKVEVLEAMQVRVRRIATGLTQGEGGIDEAKARLELRDLAEKLGYGPGGKNAFDRMMTKDEEGTLLDLTSRARIDLILDTNVARVRAKGWEAGGDDPDLLRLWPARELVRVRAARQPRNWARKWRAAAVAAGSAPAVLRAFAATGRMIALKDDPIWLLPLEQGGFNRFGDPFSPFDFNSGMETFDRSRTVALELGLITRASPAPAAVPPRPPGQEPPALAQTAAPAGDLAQLIQDALRAKGLATQIRDGVLRLLRRAG